jgi:hypothetical protein
VNQADAHNAIDAIPQLFGVSRARAHELVTDPDQLNQGAFGVCAMTSAVRSLLIHDRRKFIDLLSTVFTQVAFRGLPLPANLLTQLRTLADAAGGRSRRQDLDFLLARAIGVIFAAAQPDVSRQQIEFSRRFNPAFGDTKGAAVNLFTLDSRLAADLNTAATATATARTAGAAPVNVAPAPLRQALEARGYWMQHQIGYAVDLANMQVDQTATGWSIGFVMDNTPRTLTVTRPAGAGDLAVATTLTGVFYEEGHLAVDPDGFQVMLKEIVGFPQVTVSTYQLDYAIDQINLLLGTKQYPFAYAGISSFAEFQQAKNQVGPPVPFTVKPAPIASYYGRAEPIPEHWVVINGQITQVGGVYTLPVWTWAKAFPIQISREQLGNYIFRFVYGLVRA